MSYDTFPITKDDINPTLSALYISRVERFLLFKSTTSPFSLRGATTHTHAELKWPRLPKVGTYASHGGVVPKLRLRRSFSTFLVHLFSPLFSPLGTPFVFALELYIVRLREVLSADLGAYGRTSMRGILS